jgi:hypothetical protein
MWAGDNWQEDLERLKALQAMDSKSSSEKQEEFVLVTHLHPMACPLCQTLVGSKDNEIACPSCNVGLRRVVPFVKVCEPGWHWIIDDESREILLMLWKEK